ncbi:glutaredoxin [Sporolactobacillus sp. THM7-7]|nr:glutaredoxin [Sporolactobacillus sp. THM7-7]
MITVPCLKWRSVYMADKKVILVTKEGCPYCQRAKEILNQSLSDRYNDRIDFVEQHADADQFSQLQDQYHFQTVPTFIDRKTGDTLSASEEGVITQFLQKHLAG